jgi:hypothetical protein
MFGVHISHSGVQLDPSSEEFDWRAAVRFAKVEAGGFRPLLYQALPVVMRQVAELRPYSPGGFTLTGDLDPIGRQDCLFPM